MGSAEATAAAGSLFEAGRRGAEVRSDCWVGLELRGSGGIELELRSRVAVLYGDSLRVQVRETMAALGVPHARIELEDAGALPWVLMARLEAAVRKARAAAGRPLCADDGAPPAIEPSVRPVPERVRLRRSRLYLPGNEPKFMLNAGLHRPDGLILDLEDSVAPAVKEEARLLVRNALRVLDFGPAERMVRINQGDRGLADLDYVVPHGVDLILIPKVESSEDVRCVAERVRALASEHKLARPVFLMPIIESARGVLRAEDIATAAPEVVALTIGLEDFTADLGITRTEEGRESFLARSQIVLAARSAGVQPIDTVYSDVDNEDGLRASVREARGLGFVGKGCIHPRQIRVIHETFTPAPAELEKARRIIAAFEEAQLRDVGVVTLGSKMIDAPVVAQAFAVVRAAEAAP
ncbi:MAG: HpcH/HpaI aldolase/citrate lyase family protein [Phycisphaerales bacterium]|nr:HpcH/HpaI aldolase/citrate lyase family protein [Phycisphaerales bacterium]